MRAFSLTAIPKQRYKKERRREAGREMEKPRERRKGREYQSFKNVPHFVRAIGEPLVVVNKPRYTFECYNVCHFGWEFDRSDVHMEMRDRNPQGTYEKDRKRCDKFLAKRERLLEQVGEGEPNAVSLQEHSTTNKSTATNGESRAQLELSTGDQNSTAGSWRWSSAAGQTSRVPDDCSYAELV